MFPSGASGAPSRNAAVRPAGLVGRRGERQPAVREAGGERPEGRETGDRSVCRSVGQSVGLSVGL